MYFIFWYFYTFVGKVDYMCNFNNILIKPTKRWSNHKVTPLIAPHMVKAQSRFRPGCSVHDHIFIIKQLSNREEDNTEKRNILSFYWFGESFRSNTKSRSMKKPAEQRSKQKNYKLNTYTCICMYIYGNNEYYIIKNNTKLEGFKTEVGVRQG